MHPQFDNIIYLDHAALTPPLPALMGNPESWLQAASFNPHAGNQYSEELLRSIKNGERNLLHSLGATEFEAEVIWTSGGTEANNLAVLGLTRSLPETAVLVESTAHKALLEPAQQVQREAGTCFEVPVTRAGRLQWDQVKPDHAATASLVGVCHVNNETGTIQDLIRLRSWMNRQTPNAFLMVDALQSFGKLEIPWREAGIDLLSIGGRKIGGPGHVGALIVRRGVPLQPLMYGGGQQRNLRPGTMDGAGIITFLQAAETVCGNRKQHFEHVSKLNKYLRDSFYHNWNGPPPVMVSPADGSPYILSLLFPGCEGAIVVRALARKNIIAGSGSACSAENQAPSHVLKAMGIKADKARGLVRLSFNYNNHIEQLQQFIVTLAEVIKDY